MSGAFRGTPGQFYAARLRGPSEARAAVLAALAAGEPHLLVRVADLAGTALGLPRRRGGRLGLVAETLRAALRESSGACRRSRLPSRLDRAMRVLVADTLITFTYELAADLPGRPGDVVRRLLAEAFRADGFLAGLASDDVPEPDPDREASLFLGHALVELGRLEGRSANGAGIEPALSSIIHQAAALDPGGGPALPLEQDSLPAGLREAFEIWHSIAAAGAARGRRSGAGSPSAAPA